MLGIERSVVVSKMAGTSTKKAPEPNSGKPKKKCFTANEPVWWSYNGTWVSCRIQTVLGDGYFDIAIVDSTTKKELGRDIVFGIEGSRIRSQVDKDPKVDDPKIRSCT